MLKADKIGLSKQFLVFRHSIIIIVAVVLIIIKIKIRKIKFGKFLKLKSNFSKHYTVMRTGKITDCTEVAAEKGYAPGKVSRIKTDSTVG